MWKDEFSTALSHNNGIQLIFVPLRSSKTTDAKRYALEWNRMKDEIEAKIEFQKVIGEANPGGYQPVRFTRVKYKASSTAHIDIRQFQRAPADEDDEEDKYYPTKNQPTYGWLGFQCWAIARRTIRHFLENAPIVTFTNTLRERDP